MNKLVVMATVLVAAASASAQDVWDYKASVKNMYLKQISVRDQWGFNNTVYVKTVESTSLKGYLIQDAVRGWLVVQNTGARPSSFATPRIMPAWLMAKVADPTLRAVNRNSGTIQAQGYLAAGSVGVWSDNVVDYPDYSFLATPFDWDMTSAYLFGQLNSPSFNTGGQVWDPIADDWVDGPTRWWETWMNHAGIGKARFNIDGDICCGREAVGGDIFVESLSGALKGGLFLCSVNGDTINHEGTFEGGVWEMPLYVGWENTDLDNVDSTMTDVLYGTWSIKYNTRLARNDTGLPVWAEQAVGVAANANVAMVNAAIKALKPGAGFGRADNAVQTQIGNPAGAVSEKFALASGLLP